MSALRLSREEARRIAVRAQLLDARRPADLVETVARLTFLQIDPTAAIAPAADLVAWSRLGSAYRPEQLKQALEEDRALFEHNALVRPMSDAASFSPKRRHGPRTKNRVSSSARTTRSGATSSTGSPTPGR